ncbi:hypothetical protein Vadar_020620 [Vaccinium darrowii]|uniref:Uncharacterized protein n=1 Tax=Vaccinium darrowii TaxID=229202 RepID=A0ACB7ZD33_9ERIC|nr:hypothetical protein Vadar_020620 [Vaccinium darrowii]
MVEPDVISLDESFEECPQTAQFILVGKILATKTLNKQGVQKIIERAWRTEEDFSISPWKDNIYAFGFKNEKDLSKIIGNGPWSVMGSLMVLRRWDSKKSFSELDFTFSPFWVQIHGLPLGYINTKSGKVIAESLGDVIAVEDPGKWGKVASYIRVRVWVNVSKPLKKGSFLRRPKEEDLWLSFSSLRAENAVNDTIQYGDNPWPKLIYPERNTQQTTAVDTSKGGACLVDDSQCVDKPYQLGTQSDLGANSGDRVVERSFVHTDSQEGATSQKRTNGEGIRLGESLQPKDREKSTEKEVKTMGDGPKVVGPQYFVEEPDSPRSNQLVSSLNPFNVALVDQLNFSGPSFNEAQSQELGFILKPIDEGLAKAFDLTLNLKRKGSGSVEEEDGAKKQKLITDGESTENGKEGVKYSEIEAGRFKDLAQLNHGVNVRGRGRRGGRSSGFSRKQSRVSPRVQECNLIDVEVSEGHFFQGGGVTHKNREVNSEEGNGATVVSNLDRVLVAGPKQPQAQW